MVTIAQQFLSAEIVYKEYDFQARKDRRDEVMNRDVASENLLLIKKILEQFDIKFTLLFSTVLGAVREKISLSLI